MLIKAGADVNAENSWRMTPLGIAMLKNHIACVKRLLDEDDVNVDCKDSQGRTLLGLSLHSLNEDSYEFIEYLIKTKKANVNHQDLEGNTPLHYLAKT
jgi:ankyrin repeat protein